MHRSVRRYFELRARGEASFDAVRDFYENVLEEHRVRRQVPGAAYKQIGLEQLRAFVEKQGRTEILPLSMETSFSLDLGGVLWGAH